MKYDMELHFVHRNGTEADYLVLTVFFNIGPTENAFLKKINYSAASATADAEIAISDSVNIFELLGKAQNSGEYISYPGSFTTPPCTEGVTFILFRDFQQMSKAQWDTYASYITLTNTMVYATATTGNFRGVQALNSRTLTLNFGVADASNLIKFIGTISSLILLYFIN